eukprot:3879472-Rhodomonas_salina.1
MREGREERRGRREERAKRQREEDGREREQRKRRASEREDNARTQRRGVEESERACVCVCERERERERRKRKRPPTHTERELSGERESEESESRGESESESGERREEREESEGARARAREAREEERGERAYVRERARRAVERGGVRPMQQASVTLHLQLVCARARARERRSATCGGGRRFGTVALTLCSETPAPFRAQITHRQRNGSSLERPQNVCSCEWQYCFNVHHGRRSCSAPPRKAESKKQDAAIRVKRGEARTGTYEENPAAAHAAASTSKQKSNAPGLR